jgi:predicted nucleotidyltransferase
VTFNTYLLDEILAHRQDRLEHERQLVLDRVIQWLEAFGIQYGIHRAYLFGSLTRPGRFKETSDVDIAVEQMNPEDFFTVLGLLAEAIGRETDLVQLDKCHFANRIRQTGILWTKTS